MHFSKKPKKHKKNSTARISKLDIYKCPKIKNPRIEFQKVFVTTKLYGFYINYSLAFSVTFFNIKKY